MEIFAASSAVCLLFGFIVVNFNSNRFGYQAMELLNAQYVTAGVIALVPPLLGWFFVLYVLSDWQLKPLDHPMLLIFVVCGAAISLLLPVFMHNWIAQRNFTIRFILLIVIGFFATFPILLFGWLFTQKWTPVTLLTALFAILFIVIYLKAFSFHVYGDIHATLGGGKPRVVRLIPKPEGIQVLTYAGLKFHDNCPMTPQLHLLTSNEREYIVVFGQPGSHTISVARDSVQSVLYEPDDKQIPEQCVSAK